MCVQSSFISSLQKINRKKKKKKHREVLDVVYIVGHRVFITGQVMHTVDTAEAAIAVAITKA